jgi:hypothetical protein
VIGAQTSADNFALCLVVRELTRGLATHVAAMRRKRAADRIADSAARGEHSDVGQSLLLSV